jgi:hypothetical protein
VPDRTVEPTLLDKVDELSRKLDEIRAAVDREADSRVAEAEALRLKFYTARRSVHLSLVALILVVALVVVLVAVRWRDDRSQDQARTDLLVAACLNTNAARQASQARIEQAGGLLLDALVEITPAASQAEKDRVNVLIAQVEASYVAKMRETWPVELRPRDCSEGAVTSPTVVGQQAG